MKALIAAALAFFSAFVQAQHAYPERAVRFVVQFPPGSAPDITARLVGEQLAGVWGKPVVVENILGAAGSVGAAHVARSAPDGHTLLFSGDAAMTTNVSLYESLSYDPLKDFLPITLAVEAANILVVHPSVPARDVAQLLALARAQPGKLSFASAGNGTSQHLAGELLKQLGGVELVHVPYKGGPAAIQDVLAGRVTMMFANVVNALPLIREGKLRGLGVSSLKRWPAAPDLPSMAEAGLPAFEAVAWFGLLAPAGTSAAIIRKVHHDTTAVLAHRDVRARLADAGLEIVANSPEEFYARIRDEIPRKGRVIKAAGARPD
jgi:tripartite-type tricarboxylate transporter receptor subunit TctC